MMNKRFGKPKFYRLNYYWRLKVKKNLRKLFFMHPYIPHLLTDIEKAKRQNNNQPHDPKPLSFEEQMEEVERWVSGDGEQPLSYFNGLKKQDFPPAEQLSLKEVESVCNAFDGMLETWNIIVDYPEKMPIHERYSFLREKVVEKRISPMGFGSIHLDFCTSNPEGCDWGKYCSCLKYQQDDLKQS